MSQSNIYRILISSQTKNQRHSHRQMKYNNFNRFGIFDKPETAFTHEKITELAIYQLYKYIFSIVKKHSRHKLLKSI